MEEVENKKNKNTKKIIVLVVFLAVFAAVILLLVNLFNEKTTVTTGGSEVTSSASLYCTTKSTNVDGAFFDLTNATSADQAIKVLFKNNKIDNIAYNATATYQDPDVAKNAHATLQVTYGKYDKKTNSTTGDISSNFATDKNEIKINVYANNKQLNSASDKIFLIDANNADLDNYTPKVLSTLYKSKGFTCESNDKS